MKPALANVVFTASFAMSAMASWPLIPTNEPVPPDIVNESAAKGDRSLEKSMVEPVDVMSPDMLKVPESGAAMAVPTHRVATSASADAHRMKFKCSPYRKPGLRGMGNVLGRHLQLKHRILISKNQSITMPRPRDRANPCTFKGRKVEINFYLKLQDLNAPGTASLRSEKCNRRSGNHGSSLRRDGS